MPRVELMEPGGLCFTICTRQTETLLRAWFDEILPYAHWKGRPGIDDFEIIWPKVNVWPMWSHQGNGLLDPDWLTDSRVLGRMMELQGKNGDEGLASLLRIRRELEKELAGMVR
jgi:hypothetical protein